MAWDYFVQQTKRNSASHTLTNAKAFLTSLRYGTIALHGGSHFDPLELYWKPSSGKVAQALVGALKKFLRHQEEVIKGSDDPFCIFLATITQQLRPSDTRGTGFSQLAHLEDRRDPQAVNAPFKWDFEENPEDGIEVGDVFRFPPDLWLPFLQYAHRLDTAPGTSLERWDATGRAHASLLSLGLRYTTPLHIWKEDVSFSRERLATVILKHPTAYLERHSRKTREQLLMQLGWQARNRCSGRLHAGWKNLALNKQHWAPTYWLPGTHELASAILWDYIYRVREPVMAERRRLGLPDHPFLLVCTSDAPAKGQFIGDPYTRKAATGSWHRAMKRLATKNPDLDLSVRKENGTTMHGVRHLMGFQCIERGLTLSETAEVLHHRSPISTLTYTKRLSTEISDKLNHAADSDPQNIAALSDTQQREKSFLIALRNQSIWSIKS